MALSAGGEHECGVDAVQVGDREIWPWVTGWRWVGHQAIESWRWITAPLGALACTRMTTARVRGAALQVSTVRA